MSKKTIPTLRSQYGMNPIILFLIFLLCAVTLFVVISDQTQLQQEEVLEKIYFQQQQHVAFPSSIITQQQNKMGY